ncbi:MAG: DUF3631 domain-containing protein [Deltaproteobacteria bacterium]|nr:DUF3631 domain-containing protein [Deltaproteobacteria bacterium]
MTNRVDLIELLHARGLFCPLFEELFNIASDAWSAEGEVTILCLFHDEKTASMGVDGIGGRFHCFGCGVGGGVLHALEKKHGLGREEARAWIINWLTQRGEHIDNTDDRMHVQEQLEPARDFSEKLKRAQAHIADGIPEWAQGLVDEVETNHAALVALGAGVLPAWGDDETGEPVRIIIPAYDQNEKLVGLKLREPKSEKRKYIRNYLGSKDGLMGYRTLAATPNAVVVLASGASDSLALAKAFPELSIVAPLCGENSWQSGWGRAFEHRDVALWYDNDSTGRKGEQKAKLGLREWAAKVRTVRWPAGLEGVKDARDYLRVHGVDAARELLHAASADDGQVRTLLFECGVLDIPKGASFDSVVGPLADLASRLSDADSLLHTAASADAKKELQGRGFTATDAKNLVTAALGKPSAPSREEGGAGGAGRPLVFENPEPWPEAVDGAALVEQMEALFTKYLVLPEGAPIVLAVWCLYTWGSDCFDVATYVCLRSPRPRCGKSNTINVIHRLAHWCVPTVNTSVAALFRMLDRDAPTILMDEGDTMFGKKHTDKSVELQGILNAGYTRTAARVIRTVGDSFEPRVFSVFSPKVFALIGVLPPTLEDRCVDIPMQRRMKRERVSKMRDRVLDAECVNMDRMAYRWTLDHTDELTAARPDELMNVDDRKSQVTEPLLAVADAVGGDVRERLRKALQSLCAVKEISDDDAGTLLLSEFRVLFEAQASERVSTKSATQWLGDREDRPWSSWGRSGKPITSVAIARLLKGFGPTPKQWREGKTVVRGYLKQSFGRAWESYCPSEGDSDPVQPLHGHNASGDGSLGDLAYPVQADGAEGTRYTANEDGQTSYDGVTGVPGRKPGSGQGTFPGMDEEQRERAPTPDEIVRRLEQDYEE